MAIVAIFSIAPRAFIEAGHPGSDGADLSGIGRDAAGQHGDAPGHLHERPAR
jgi:hypothetical protein